MNAYIVAGRRSAVGKAKRGGFRFTRPDTLAAEGLNITVVNCRYLKPYDEATLFSLSAQIEAARPWAHRRPPVS